MDPGLERLSRVVAEAFPPPPPGPPPPPEPAELRRQMASLAADAPDRVRGVLGRGEWLADYLWREWADRLEPGGVDRALVVAELARWSRELWLWVMGERRWQEVAGLVYGGLLRKGPRWCAGQGRADPGVRPVPRASPSSRGRPPGGSG